MSKKKKRKRNKPNALPYLQSDQILAFCKSVVKGQQLRYVIHQPLRNKPLQECFSIVPEKIATDGGKQHFGWAIFEIEKIWLEAEFHTVWERPNGQWVDITPREIPLRKIAFLPDPERKYEGIQVASIYHPLTDNPDVLRYIQLRNEHFRITNEGDLAYQRKVRIPALLAHAIEHEMEELRLKIPWPWAR